MKLIVVTICCLFFVNLTIAQYNYGLDLDTLDLKVRGLIDLDDGNNNVYIGSLVGVNNKADGNVFIGGGAGFLSTAAYSNVFLGAGAGTSNIDGSSNVYIGTSVGAQSMNGDQNVYIGGSAAVTNEGSANVIIGYQAGYPQNGSAVSYQGNVLIGKMAGSNSSGSSNVFIGDNAGANATGSNMLYIENTNSNDPLIQGDFLSDVVVINGSMHISEFTKLTPQNSPPVNPEKGTIYYDDTDDKVKVWNGSNWDNLN